MPVPSRRLLVSIAVAGAVATVAGMLLTWPGETVAPTGGTIGFAAETFEAEVFESTVGPCLGTDAAAGVDCRQVGFELTEGPDRGQLVRLDFPLLASSPDFEVGDRVVLNWIPEAAPGFEYQYADRQRRGVLTVIAVVFALAVVLLGRLKGLAALAGLAASLAVLILYVVPALLEGAAPMTVAVLGAAAIAYMALYAAHGLRASTTVALLGTLGALGLTAVLSQLAVQAAELTGFTSEESLLLTFLPGRIDARGLILAGIVLGSLGALDDVTVTQVSAVNEIRAANPMLPMKEVLRAGLRVGRDHIASTVNTLVLAYAGASMPLLVLFAISHQSLGAIANSEVVATEIIRTLIGSVGLVAAVPITTWLAAMLPTAGSEVEP